VVIEEINLPHFLPDAFWIVSKKIIPFSKMHGYRSLHFRRRLIIRIMDDSPLHAAKHSFDDIQELRIRREWDKRNVRASAAGAVPSIKNVGSLN